MNSTVTPLDEIDHEISIAYVALGVARSAWSRCPSAGNARLVDDAEEAMNRLLDERLATHRH